ncbi:MAG: DNA polymerase IV [Thermodesulfobacteriota bacterium]
MPPRAVIHIDIDAFFTAVEVKKNPAYRGQPVIVGGNGDPASRGVVSAASYEARAYGVASGMPLKKAYRLCPGAVFLPVDFDAYEKESERFMEMLRRYSPLVESFGLDEAFIEVPPSPGADPLDGPVRIAREIKSLIKSELGLTVSAGIAPNKLLAKMACELGKPDGFFTIHEKEVERLFNEMPARRLCGVGAKTEARLKDLGIRTIGELARTHVEYLERQFGPNIGRTLHEHARGVDASPVVPFHEPESMSREVTFEADSRDMHFIRETLFALTEDVAARLKAAGTAASTVAIKVRYRDFETITRSAPLDEATDSLNDVWALVLRLLEAVDLPKAVRLVGVKVSGLTRRVR